MMTPDLIALGEAMIEFNQQPGADPGVWKLGHGGDTSNAVIAAARQGARTGYLTALGQDAFGDDLLALWSREGVDVSQIARDPQGHTAVYFVSHGPAGHSFSYLRAGSAASLYPAAALPAAYLGGARILHLSAISQAISATACDTVFAAIEIARGAGCRISYDTNLRLKLWPLARARAIVHATVPLTDILMPSLEDATMLTGLSAPEAIADFYLGLGAGLVVLKLGAEGALVAGPDGARHRIAGHRVAACDATGAGDTFDGAFLARILAGDSAETAARHANAAAALSTTGIGAVAPMPTAEETRRFLAGLSG